MMIYDWIRTKAEKEPENIAVTHSNHHLTYGQIESDSNKLAGLLLTAGLKIGGRIGIFMEKSLDSITAIHGISKAGGVCVPLNISSPASRISRIIEEFGIDILLVDHHGYRKYKTILDMNENFSRLVWFWWSEQPLPDLETEPCFSLNDIAAQPDLSYQRIHDENQPAFILFNSGKSGRLCTKVKTHRSITAFIKWAVPFFSIKPEDRISGHSPLHFELSQFDIFGSFAAGAHLYLIPPAISNIPNLLSDFILENDLTQWFSVPSVLSYIASYDAISENGFPGLERLIWCGDAVPESTLRYWMSHLPNASFTHLYGPKKELAIASNYQMVSRIPGYREEIPLSSLFNDSEIMILTDTLESLTEGVIPAVEGIIDNQ